MSLRAVSHDPTLKHLLKLRDGRTLTAVQLQMEYLEQARKYVEDRFGADVDPITDDVLDRWESVLSRLEVDPMLCKRELDWVAKLEILEGYRSRDGLDWDDARLQLVDLQYSRRPAGQGPLQPAGGRRADRAHRRRRRGDVGAGPSRRTTPGPTSAAGASTSGPTRSPPRRGTRSSSTSAASRCSGCRRSSRCAAPRRTSARCSTAARPPLELVETISAGR